MPNEVERKYLLAGLPDRSEIVFNVEVAICQGYLSAGEPEVRVRSKGGRFYVARKSGEGLVREEEEVEVNERVFDILWPATQGVRVQKTRYEFIDPNGLTWEIDAYRDRDLVIVEVELPSAETVPIIPPAISAVLVAEVTNDKRYKNKFLALVGGVPSRPNT